MVLPFAGFSQTCDCPVAGTCNTCSGGIISLTLQYKGTAAALITVTDNGATIFSQTLNSGAQFTVDAQGANGKFNGNSVEVSINGVLNVSIDVNCSLVFDPHALYGSFGLISARSKNGGELCCTVNAVDTDPPVITGCPSNIEVTTSSTECFATVDWAAPLATDCALKSFSSTVPPGSPFTIGETTVVYTAIDLNNNQTTCSFKVTVNDAPPTMSGCPINITANAVGCSATVTWTPPTFTDNCAGLTISSSRSPGSNFSVGETEVTYTATDVSGQRAQCKFKILVNDQIAPTITNCPNDIEVTATNSSGEVAVEWVPPTATDNCKLISLSSPYEPGDIFQEGPTEIVYTATDSSGNTATCAFTVHVVVEKLSLNIGGVVTPDGNGVNDEWLIGNIEKYETNKVVIVDRWGGVVYSTAGYDNTNKVWDGRNIQGNMLPTGTYFFTISVQMGTATVEKKGFIELIR